MNIFISYFQLFRIGLSDWSVRNPINTRSNPTTMYLSSACIVNHLFFCSTLNNGPLQMSSTQSVHFILF
jgi:hypothetical protein